MADYDIDPLMQLSGLPKIGANCDLEDELVVLKSSSPEIPISPNSQGPPNVISVSSLFSVYLAPLPPPFLLPYHGMTIHLRITVLRTSL
jgi:hypothetical protein